MSKTNARKNCVSVIVLGLVLGFGTASTGLAQDPAYETRVLSGTTINVVHLSPNINTTLMFRGQVFSGLNGAGLTQEPSGQNQNGQAVDAAGAVMWQHPPNSEILVLTALRPEVNCYATGIINQSLYTFHFLADGTSRPDLAVTYAEVGDTGPNTNTAGPLAGAAGPGTPVTPAQVTADRLQYSDEELVGILNKVKQADFLRANNPELYTDYSSRPADYRVASSGWSTQVQRVSRLDRYDAVVLQGSVTNNGSTPLNFDGRAASVEVNNLIFNPKLLQCERPIEPGKTAQIAVVLMGDIDGGRKGLAVTNSYKIQLPADNSPPGVSQNGAGGDGKTEKTAEASPDAPIKNGEQIMGAPFHNYFSAFIQPVPDSSAPDAYLHTAATTGTTPVSLTTPAAPTPEKKNRVKASLELRAKDVTAQYATKGDPASSFAPLQLRENVNNNKSYIYIGKEAPTPQLYRLGDKKSIFSAPDHTKVASYRSGGWLIFDGPIGNRMVMEIGDHPDAKNRIELKSKEAKETPKDTKASASAKTNSTHANQ
jgi:hypothetical protein